MKIIRPYGRSVIQEKDLRQRKVLENKTGQVAAVRDLLESDGKAVLAQWVSAMDKIIAKPLNKKDLAAFISGVNNNKKIENKERIENNNRLALNRLALEKRKLLGEAIWAHVSDKTKPHCLEKPEDQEKWWRAKYEEAYAMSDKMHRGFPKGRWYKIFAGIEEPEHIDEVQASEIAEKIYRHFYENALASGSEKAGKEKYKGKGFLPHRIAFIGKNTLTHAYENYGKSPDRLDLTATEATMACYKYMQKGGDIAQRIRRKILAQFLETTRKEDKIKESVYIIAVLELKEKWKEIFAAGVKNIATARKTDEALFKLHQTVKETYKILLKGRSLFPDKLKDKLPKDKKEADKSRNKQIHDKLAEILPRDMKELLQLIQYKSCNRDIGHLIRLGKIIHYSSRNLTSQEQLFAAEVENSDYWTSQGQTIIKQNEAFVRIWRRLLAFAGRNVADWIAPNNDGLKDVLGGTGSCKAALKYFEEHYEGNDEEGKKYTAGFDEKYNVLFADDDGLFFNKGTKTLDALNGKGGKRPILEFIIGALTDLRNAAFHFKGMEHFVEQFGKADWVSGCERVGEEQTQEPHEAQAKIVPFLENYYHKACEAYRMRLLHILESINVHKFLNYEQIKNFLSEITAAEASPLPLPRFQKLLERSDCAWAKIGKPLLLPPYTKARDRAGDGDKDLAKNCQYNLAHMLYDKLFRAWLENLPAEKLQDFIKRAIERTTEAARKINGGKTDKELILARAGKLSAIQKNERVQWFFAGLVADSSTEGRVQKDNYKHDADAAREKAEYIEEFKQDVVALAFADYLREKQFSFILDIKDVRYRDKNFPMETLKKTLREEGTTETEKTEQNGEKADWICAKLYFLLHLMPVEEVSSLRQQIRKWEIVVDKPEVTAATKEAESEDVIEGAQEREQKTKERQEKALTQPILQALDLYIFMHDAQYVGEEIEAVTADWEEIFFEHGKGAVNKIFPAQERQKDLQAFRDLREMRRFGNTVLNDIYARKKISSEKIEQWREQKEKVEGKNGLQTELQTLHETWVKNRKNPEWQRKGKDGQEGEKYKEYREKLEIVAAYRILAGEVKLQNHVRLYRLLMAVLGRLVDFSGLFERDLYFTLLALCYQNDVKNIKAIFEDNEDSGAPIEKKEDGENLLQDGQVFKALDQLKGDYAPIKKELVKFFGDVFREEKGTSRNIRNRFAHLKMLSLPEKEEISWTQGVQINLTQEVNNTRQLMAYDRKLKNAVAKSLIDLLDREGLKLSWQMSIESVPEAAAKSDKSAPLKDKKVNHNLCNPHVETKWIPHLGSKLLDKKDKDGKPVIGKNGKPVKEAITEPRHGDIYVTMVKSLFGG